MQGQGVSTSISFFQIKEAYKSCPVLILPTHRSYVDFLLISYMSFHYELPLPIIAAGMGKVEID
jgi:glycerone phosphate O-acyltransferase